MPASNRAIQRDVAWTSTSMITRHRIAVWASAVVLAIGFVSIGVSKLEGASAARWAERFEHWGYPANARYVVGVLEILGGIGVLVPRWRPAASLLLGTLMIGALGTHIASAELPRVIPPLVLGGLAFFAYWSHRRSGG
jgi:putative oxidoreductase